MASQRPVRARLQFRLRSLFVLTAIVAVFFSAAAALSYLEAFGLLFAAGLVAGALWFRPRKPFGVLRFLFGAVGLGVLWMVAVDLSWFVERCEVCHLDRDAIQYRVLSVPVRQVTRVHSDFYARIAEDLGRTCSHRIHRWHKTRWWGLIYRARPDFQGIVRLVYTGPGWYDDGIAEVVRARGRASPELGEAFLRAVRDEDREYVTSFLAELRQLKRGDADQPQFAEEP